VRASTSHREALHVQLPDHFDVSIVAVVAGVTYGGPRGRFVLVAAAAR
jgi:hypothetical protein